MTTDPLTGIEDDDRALLQTLAESLETKIVSREALGTQVSGDGTVSGFRLQLAPRGEGAAASGTPFEQLVYVQAGGTLPAGDAVLVLRDDATGDEVAVWLYPHDPGLPALPPAVFPESASVLLQRMGLSMPEPQLSLLAYRPGRRAVVRAISGGRAVYLKVVPPAAVDELVERYREWSAAGLPVPPVLAWSPTGLVAFSPASGEPADAALDRLEPEEFLDRIAGLQAAIARIPARRPARRSLSASTDWYARRLTRLQPGLADPIEVLRHRIREALARSPAGAPVSVHGDLHMGQLFIDERGEITGVLDIDTAGLGDAADDAAAFAAHLMVTAEFHGTETDPGRRADALAERWLRRCDASALPGLARRVAAIVAAHLIAHALNPALPADALVGRAVSVLDRR